MKKVLAGLVALPLVLAGSVASAITTPRAQFVSQIASSAKMTTIPAGLTPSLATLAGAGYNSMRGSTTLADCNAATMPSQITNPTPCIRGNRNGTKTIVIIGDSTTGNWVPALDAGLKQSAYKLVVYMYLGCPAVMLNPLPAGLTQAPTVAADCATWVQNVMKLTGKTKVAAVLIAVGPMGTSSLQAAMASGMKKSFATAAPYPSERRVVLGGVVYFPIPNTQCLASRLNPSACTVGVDSGANPFILSRSKAMATAAAATLISARQYLCTATVCDGVVGNTVTAIDYDHFSVDFGLKISPYVTADVLAAIGG